MSLEKMKGDAALIDYVTLNRHRDETVRPRKVKPTREPTKAEKSTTRGMSPADAITYARERGLR